MIAKIWEFSLTKILNSQNQKTWFLEYSTDFNAKTYVHVRLTIDIIEFVR